LTNHHQKPERLASDRALLEQRAKARARETNIPLPDGPVPEAKPKDEDDSYLNGGVLSQAEWERRRRVWAHQQIANV